MKLRSHSFIITNPLEPVGPAADLFIAGASVFEITDFEPPLQRVTIVGINLPEPDTFGPYDSYVATLLASDDGTPEEIGEVLLRPTTDREVWAGITFLTFGGTLFPINVIVQPQGDDIVGPVILEGALLDIDDTDNGEEDDDNQPLTYEENVEL